MAINEADVKLKGSQRLTDNDDGGGRMTGYEIVSGDMNNLFPDISRLDRAYGRVNLRKAFVHVDTANVDVYYGAHVILTDDADDPKVSALIFGTDNHADERADAKDRIESYVIRGPLSRYWLYGRQLSGQRSIKLFAPETAAPPEVGDVLSLVQNEGQSDEHEQYVRVTAVTSETQAFNGAAGTACASFTRQIINCELSGPLRATFDGPAITCVDTITPAAVVRETQVADASTYYGTVGLLTDANPGDLVINALSVYGQLVPSTQGETPVIDVQAGGLSAVEIQSGGEAFRVVGPVHTDEIAVAINNRAFSYVRNCQPIPAPSSLRVDFRALGRWYSLYDDGQGGLFGEGGGSIDYQTGSVSLTLGALPDVGSSVLFSWSSPVHFTDRAGTTARIDPSVSMTTPEPIDPGSLTLTYTSAATQRTVTDDGAGGLTGDGSGWVSYSSGEIILIPAYLPDAGTTVDASYTEPTLITETIAAAAAGGFASATLATTPIRPRSLEVDWTATQAWTSSRTDYGIRRMRLTGYITRDAGVLSSSGVRNLAFEVVDDGAGGLPDGGTVDYNTGALSVRVDGAAQEGYYNTTQATVDWQTTTGAATYGGTLTVRYQQDAAAGPARNHSVPAATLWIDLLPSVVDDLVPGTLRFTLGGLALSDRAGQGVIYMADGTVAGSVDYDTRRIMLTDWTGATSAALSITSLVSVWGEWADHEFRFRTPGSPLQPSSLLINATDQAGNLVTVTSDLSGNLSATMAEGTVDQETGVTWVRFGERVADSSLTPQQKAEPWYNPADIDGNGDIWVPLRVWPNTVRFSAVVYTVLPLDADILGLDPVRLPRDGRVPIFRPADVVVLHQEEQYTMPPGLVASQVVSLPHDQLAYCTLADQAGTVIPDTLYSVDLAAGEVTMAAPLDLSGYTEPLVADYRIEDMRMVTDVQINGALTLTSALYHGYDKTNAQIASALIFGDLQARYHTLFTQATWTNVWADARIGNDTTAKYNDIQYPLALANEGAIKERWLIKFTSATGFDLIGETVGQIASGTIGGDLSPINPESGTPYFTLPAAGWGGGWATGNCLRFNTAAAADQVWIARTTLSGDATTNQDSFTVQIRGDGD